MLSADFKLDTSRVRQDVLETRRQILASKWDLHEACALLKITSSPETDAQLCCESLMLHAMAMDFKTARKAERFVGKQLGALALAGGGDLVDQVLRERVGWMRLLELCWLCDSFLIADLILEGPLAHHPLADVLLEEQDDFQHPLAHVKVAWEWEVDRHAIRFSVVPQTRDTPMNTTLRKALFPAN